MKIYIIGYYLTTDQIEKTCKDAEMMDNDKILEKIRYVRKNPGQDHTSENDIDAFKNIGRLKSATDQKDDLHIYKIDCRGINGEPSFAFKTSTEACKLAIKMDKNQQEEGELSVMVYERAYIDAMHSHINGYKTITMWTYHLGIMNVMRIASMEAEKEDTELLALFLRLFNEALSKVLAQEGYKFKPYGIMCV